MARVPAKTYRRCAKAAQVAADRLERKNPMFKYAPHSLYVSFVEAKFRECIRRSAKRRARR